MDRQRLTITMKKELLKQVDLAIDGTRIRNRSHAIEYLLSKSLGPSISQAFILAGGRGVKMRPFTYEMPKTMIPVHNCPILEHIINQLRENGIKDIIISIDYLGEKIKEYFKDGNKFGVKITYLQEKNPTGTAAPLLKAKKYLTSNFFLVIHGDVLANIDYHDLISFAENNKPVVTMTLTSLADPSQCGTVKLRGAKVVDFQEKIGKGPEVSRLINAGIYVMSNKIFNYIPKKNVSMLEKDVFPELTKKGLITGYFFEGQWFDISTPEIYERALKEWRK